MCVPVLISIVDLGKAVPDEGAQDHGVLAGGVLAEGVIAARIQPGPLVQDLNVRTWTSGSVFWSWSWV